ncbi:MAG TPA: hypothetical protein VK668_14055 [Mucilaginibacter sp.]|nr:hypothetical protein [Mucilaginibacter sp.]
MPELFKNKYRIASARLQTWDYAENAMYFITICTANRECYFGEIVETTLAETQYVVSQNRMQLNDLGLIAEMEWLNTSELRPDMNLELAEYVIMPNHFHGIILIGENTYNSEQRGDDQTDHKKNEFGPQSKNLASIVRGFKSAVTTFARKNNIPFDWQTRFHDHIIRDHEEYLRIADYIMNNPDKWQEDVFYTNAL